KRLRAAPGNIRARLVEARAFITVEAVAGTLVDVDLAVGALLFDRLHIRHRDALVLVAEMHLRRTCGLFIGECGDPAAVVADGGGEREMLAQLTLLISRDAGMVGRSGAGG